MQYNGSRSGTFQGGLNRTLPETLLNCSNGRYIVDNDISASYLSYLFLAISSLLHLLVHYYMTMYSSVRAASTSIFWGSLYPLSFSTLPNPNSLSFSLLDPHSPLPHPTTIPILLHSLVVYLTKDWWGECTQASSRCRSKFECASKIPLREERWLCLQYSLYAIHSDGSPSMHSRASTMSSTMLERLPLKRWGGAGQEMLNICCREDEHLLSICYRSTNSQH